MIHLKNNDSFKNIVLNNILCLLNFINIIKYLLTLLNVK